MTLKAIQQRIADGGTHEVVTQLDRALSPGQVTATMKLLSAQVNVEQLNGKPPDQHKIKLLAPAIETAARRFPELPDTWATTASLATFRTVDLHLTPTPAQTQALPDCDSKAATRRLMYPEDLPEFKFPSRAGFEAYVFQNCRLYMDRLPGHRLLVHMDRGQSINGVPLPRTAVIGQKAYARNVIIVMTNKGVSDTDILYLMTANCRFQFEVDQPPAPAGQELMLAALTSPEEGSLEVEFN